MTETVRAIQLAWHGACRFSDTSILPGSAIAPSRPGVYVWVVGWPQLRIPSYAGQTTDLRGRTADHVKNLLSGRDPLLDPDLLAQSRYREVYRPNSAAWDLATSAHAASHRQLAAANLRAYEVYWAVLDVHERVLQSVESGLISALRAVAGLPDDCNHKNQLSLRHENAPAVTVASVLPPGVRFSRFPMSYSYGVLPD